MVLSGHVGLFRCSFDLYVCVNSIAVCMCIGVGSGGATGARAPPTFCLCAIAKALMALCAHVHAECTPQSKCFSYATELCVCLCRIPETDRFSKPESLYLEEVLYSIHYYGTLYIATFENVCRTKHASSKNKKGKQ